MNEDGDAIQGILGPDGQWLNMPNVCRGGPASKILHVYRHV